MSTSFTSDNWQYRKSKLVRISYENLQSNAESISKYLNINQTDKPITSLPMHYSFGLSVINSHIIKCNNSTYWSFNYEKTILDFFKSQNATIEFHTFYLLKKLKFLKWISFKNLNTAGGRLDNNLILEFENFTEAKKANSMYGQTEASPRMSYLLIMIYSKNWKYWNTIQEGNLLWLIKWRSYKKWNWES